MGRVIQVILCATTAALLASCHAGNTKSVSGPQEPVCAVAEGVADPDCGSEPPPPPEPKPPKEVPDRPEPVPPDPATERQHRRLTDQAIKVVRESQASAENKAAAIRALEERHEKCKVNREFCN